MTFDDDNDLPIPVINDDTPELSDEQIQEMLEDTSPTETQRSLMNSGGVLFTPSYRTADSGIPIGMPPEKFEGQKVRLMPLKGDGSDGPSASFIVDGRADPIVRQVLDKYKLQPGESRTAEEHHRIYEKIMTEIAVLKKQQRPKPQPERRMEPQASLVAVDGGKPPVKVKFDFGGVGGKHHASYTDAYIDGNLLVLVVSERDRRIGFYEPPDLGPNHVVTVTIDGLPVPVNVRLVGGMQHSYGGNTFFLAFIDRTEEE